MTGAERRRQANDRARRRAIRALAAQMGVPYSVAARVIADPHRAMMFALREQRPFHARVQDTRAAAAPPLGRAAHLTARFPRLRTAVGRLYDGRDRQTVLAMLYAVVAHESPSLLPAAEELAWVAELGEETAVDITCAALDRAARLLLDDDQWRLWTRVEAALAAADPRAEATIVLGRELRPAGNEGRQAAVRDCVHARGKGPSRRAHQGHRHARCRRSAERHRALRRARQIARDRRGRILPRRPDRACRRQCRRLPARPRRRHP